MKSEGWKNEGGLRKKGYFQKSYTGKPLISIITVVLNSERYLEETILSVINQPYDNIEYIIIDGGSSDGTLDIIKKYENKINYWVSEKDSGIYEAMNKGIALVTGDWVNFVNSSDTINKDAYGVISDYLVDCSHQCNVVAFGYSFTKINSKGILSKVERKPSLKKKWKMPSSHNTIIYKSNVLRENKFNLSFKCASDFDQINRINSTKKICKNNYILSNIRIDGFISQNKFQSFLEYIQICWQGSNKIYTPYLFGRLVLIYLSIKIRKFL